MSQGGVLTFGESMALFVSQSVGPLPHARTAEIRVGGAESSVAIGLSRLGVAARWIGRVGDDPLGDLVEQTIRSQGVDARVVRDPAPTGVMIKERRLPSGGRVLYYRAGRAGSRLESTDIPEELIESAALVHVTGITPALWRSRTCAIAGGRGLPRQCTPTAGTTSSSSAGSTGAAN